MKRVVLAFLLVLPGLVSALSGPPPLCRVTGSTTRTAPGVYAVKIEVRPECPENGYALVRMGGGSNTPWRVVTPGQPTTFRRIPWYWRADWQAASGKTYPIPLPGMLAPWEKTP